MSPNPDDNQQQDVLNELKENGAVEQRYVLNKNSKHRLDQFLQNRLKGLSRNQVQKLIGLSGVLVNGKVAKASLKLRQGDVIDVLVPKRPSVDLNPEPIALDVLYEDDGFIVINKQANLVIHPARSHLNGTLLNALAYHFAQENASRAGASPIKDNKENHSTGSSLSAVGKSDARPGVIHRLDKNTTGVIVVGKRDQAHWHIAKQFENRTNLKAYLAVVHGNIYPAAGVIDQPIGQHPTAREAQAVRRSSTSKEALTVYRVRERYKGYCLVEVELKTGRTHQIRVHLSYMGHPIVGDIMYGGEIVSQQDLDNPPAAAGGRPLLTFARSKEEGQKLEEQASLRQDIVMATPALHAAFLKIRHPVTNKDMTFTAPLHKAMSNLVNLLRQRPESGEVVEKGVLIDLSKTAP